MILGLYLAPGQYVNSTSAYADPEREMAGEKKKVELGKVLADYKFWLYAIDNVKVSLCLFVTSILVGVVADWNDLSKTFFVAAIPLLILIGGALIASLYVAMFMADKVEKPATEEAQTDQGDAAQKAAQDSAGSTVCGATIAWVFKYGMLLIVVCTMAAKLTDINAFSAFAIFSPVFAVVGCGCCLCSCFALFVTGDDLQESAQQAQQQQQGGQEETEVNTQNQAEYGTVQQDVQYGVVQDVQMADVKIDIS